MIIQSAVIILHVDRSLNRSLEICPAIFANAIFIQDSPSIQSTVINGVLQIGLN